MKTRSKSMFNIFTLVALLASLLGSAVIATPAYAAGISVTTNADTFDVAGKVCADVVISDLPGADTFTSLREAICAANNTAGTDTITFAADYTITLGSQLPAIQSAITITGNGAANTIVQASTCNPVSGDDSATVVPVEDNCTPASYRVFHVVSATLNLQDLTVANGVCAGSCDGTFDWYRGGGILIDATTTLNLTNVTFTSNRASAGGAVSNNGQMNIVNSTFSDNKVSGGNSGGAGGAIYNYNTVTITGSTFTNNLAESAVVNAITEGGKGGAIYNDSDKNLDVTSSTFTDNKADISGGAIYRDGGGTVEVKNSIFTNNKVTTGKGGAIYTGSGSTQLLVVNSEFSGNTTLGADGGAIYNIDGPITVNSSAFSSNSAPNGYGGGISTILGNSTIVNSTFSENTGRSGGGINNDSATSTITNSTFYKNVALGNNGNNGGNVSSGTTLTLKNTLLVHGAATNNCYGSNIIADNTNIETPIDPGFDSSYYCGNSITQKTEAQINLDATLQNNGGGTKTHALLAGSAAINEGTNTGCPSTDQRGVSRPVNGTCDIGAFEYERQTGPVFVVNTNDDSDDTKCDAYLAGYSDCTLREAINAANTHAGTDRITFDAALVTNPITLVGSQLPAVTTAIIINGNGQANTIIQADADFNAATYRVFEVTSTGDLSLKNLTVQNGVCAGSCPTSPNDGGGILNVGHLSITNSTLANNYTSNAGGAVYNSGNLTIVNGNFSRNHSTDYIGGAIYTTGISLTVIGSSFDTNYAIYGGGISNISSVMIVTDSEFLNNTANSSGGGIYNSSALPSAITGGVFRSNSAENFHGGGIYNSTGTNLTVTNSEFDDNHADAPDGSGGGIYNKGSIIVTESNIHDNTAYSFGGGIYNSDSLFLSDSTVKENSASGSGGFGGGLANVTPGETTVTGSSFISNIATSGGGGGGAYNQKNITIANSTFNGNSASGGGGIMTVLPGSVLTITNSTLAGNLAIGGDGGGIMASSGAVTITNSTLVGNSATGPGLYNGGGIWSDTSATLYNTIVANNTTGNCSGTIGVLADNKNLSTDNTCNLATQKTLAQINLGALQDNGGLTFTIAPQPGSVAIGAGDSAKCSAAVGSPNYGAGGVDQRGVSRSSTCDVGAVQQGMAIKSTDNNDGWTLESKEFSNIANTKMNIGNLRVGDDAKNRQYRSLLYFDTAYIPNNAVISKAIVRIKKESITVDDPFATLGNLVADMKKGTFGLAALQPGDFSALAAPINTAGKFFESGGTYTLTISPANFKYINLVGATQFRVRFIKDDNNDKDADYISFYGDGSGVNAPQFVIEYSLP